METVYVVMGTCGEYSDRSEWPVCAYADEDLAKAHVLNADAAAAGLHATYGRYRDAPKGANPYDPRMQTDSTGTSYYYHAVELREALPPPAATTSR